ncbi:MAG: serine O-acetyltransferase [Planctomycetota bacterium]|nr:serine O-acetyltransferase [Planctomycetota bacterium]
MTQPSQDADNAMAGPRIERSLVDELVRGIVSEPRTRHLGEAPLPSWRRVEELVQLVRELAFPGFFGARGLSEDSLPGHVQQLVARIAAHCMEQARSCLRYAEHLPFANENALRSRECDEEARRITERFLERLPTMRAALALDVQAAFDGDPAATHTDETIFCYPGVDAVFAYRVARIFYELEAPLLSRIISEQAHSRTGIDIHPGAEIGPSFFIDHGAGVVIGETSVIGEHVKIYQGVTLGAKSFPKDERGRLIRGTKRHPTIGNRVTIYAGAVILGGDTVIGDDCVVSGGVFLTQSVPPRHIVRQKKPELVMRSNREAPEV